MANKKFNSGLSQVLLLNFRQKQNTIKVKQVRLQIPLNSTPKIKDKVKNKADEYCYGSSSQDLPFFLKLVTLKWGE